MDTHHPLEPQQQQALDDVGAKVGLSIVPTSAMSVCEGCVRGIEEASESWWVTRELTQY